MTRRPNYSPEGTRRRIHSLTEEEEEGEEYWLTRDNCFHRGLVITEFTAGNPNLAFGLLLKQKTEETGERRKARNWRYFIYWIYIFLLFSYFICLEIPCFFCEALHGHVAKQRGKYQAFSSFFWPFSFCTSLWLTRGLPRHCYADKKAPAT